MTPLLNVGFMLADRRSNDDPTKSQLNGLVRLVNMLVEIEHRELVFWITFTLFTFGVF